MVLCEVWPDLRPHSERRCPSWIGAVWVWTSDQSKKTFCGTQASL